MTTREAIPLEEIARCQEEDVEGLGGLWSTDLRENAFLEESITLVTVVKD